MKMKPFFTFWQIGTSETTVREGSESNSKWKKIYMQISVLSFTGGYDPKMGHIYLGHLRRELHLLRVAHLQRRQQFDKMILTPHHKSFFLHVELTTNCLEMTLGSSSNYVNYLKTPPLMTTEISRVY